MKKLLAESIGTFALVFAGTGAIVINAASNGGVTHVGIALTFGLVILEALACGVPVAAYPVQGPLDVVGDAAVAVLDEDLAKACKAALAIPRESCRAYALTRSWDACTRQFLSNLAVEPAVEI